MARIKEANINAKANGGTGMEFPHSSRVDSSITDDRLKLNRRQMQTFWDFIVITQRFFPQHFLKIVGQQNKLEPFAKTAKSMNFSFGKLVQPIRL